MKKTSYHRLSSYLKLKHLKNVRFIKTASTIGVSVMHSTKFRITNMASPRVFKLRTEQKSWNTVKLTTILVSVKIPSRVNNPGVSINKYSLSNYIGKGYPQNHTWNGLIGMTLPETSGNVTHFLPVDTFCKLTTLSR